MFYTSDKLQHLETVMNEELKLVFKYWITNKLSINLATTNYSGNLIFKRLNGSIRIQYIILNGKVKYNILVYILIKMYTGDPRFNA